MKRNPDSIQPSGGGRRSRRAGFTLVELLVVIAIIILVLGIGLPGLARMFSEVRANAGIQAISSTLSRAYFTAEADSNWVAVRFMPGAWDFSTADEPAPSTERQHVVMYERRSDRRYPATGALAPPGSDSQLTEYFVRIPGADSIILPEDLWVAPGDVMATGPRGDRYTKFLAGQRNRFEMDPRAENVPAGFLNSDDFLLIFEPGKGLRTPPPPPTGNVAYTAERHLLKSYVARDAVVAGSQDKDAEVVGSWGPLDPLRIGGYHRYAFGSLALYSRSGFNALDVGGSPASATDRQNWLRQNGRAAAIPAHGGGLIEGPSATQ